MNKEFENILRENIRDLLMEQMSANGISTGISPKQYRQHLKDKIADYNNKLRIQLIPGSKWIHRAGWGDVIDLEITPDSNRKVIITVINVSKRYVKYILDYPGNPTPGSIHTSSIKEFLIAYKPKEIKVKSDIIGVQKKEPQI